MDTKKLRQKILDLAIRGKLVPQDPNDEPASVLLERIRAEKERLIAEGKIKRPKKSKASSAPSHYQHFDPPFPIPDSWEWVRLDEVCSIKGGKRIPRGKTFSTDKTSHVYLRVTDMKNNTIITSDFKYIDDDVYESIKNYTIKSSDLYLTIAGTIGSVGIVPPEVNGMNLTENAAKLTNIACFKEFLLYALLSTSVQEHFSSRFHQVAQPKLSIETASSTYIPLPPFSEQQRIVTEIKNWLNQISRIENEQYNLQTYLVQTKSKILDIAMQGKLVPQDPSDEPAADMLRRINPKAKIITDTQHYRSIPNNWTTVSFTDICNTALGKTLNKESDIGEMHPYLCAINVKDGYFDLNTIKHTKILPEEFERYSVYKGDLLVCEGGDVGRCAIWQGDRIFFQNALHRIRPLMGIEQKFLRYFLLYAKNKHWIDELCSGVTIKHFTTKAMSNLVIAIPPNKEQKRIIEKIENLFELLNAIEEELMR